MPKKLHDELERRAKKKGLKGKRKDAYVYGTLNKITGHHSASNGEFLDKLIRKFL